MSESSMTKRLHAQVAAKRLRAENERLKLLNRLIECEAQIGEALREIAELKERLSVAVDKEIKLLDSLIECEAQIGEALREIAELKERLSRAAVLRGQRRPLEGWAGTRRRRGNGDERRAGGMT